MPSGDFFVEFEIADRIRFEKLTAVFIALKAAKESDDWRDTAYWRGFFDDQALATFWWPTDAEIKDWERRWYATPLPQRWEDPSLKMPWLFEALIHAFRNGDYALIACHRTTSDNGRIEFDPYGHPYGGTECMEVLIKSFGQRVIASHG